MYIWKYENSLKEKWSSNHPSEGNIQLNASIYTVHLWSLQKYTGEDKIYKKGSHKFCTETTWLLLQAPAFLQQKHFISSPMRTPI